MLVGDYCPRALDPVFLLKDVFLEEVDEILENKEAELEEEQYQEPKEKQGQESATTSADEQPEPKQQPVQKKKPVASTPKKATPAPRVRSTEPTELPCNVFGTVDRCDGMACEHDGNCYSGCCSLFVSGEQKRCMPLVNGDMCPIAIDVVEHEI